MRLGPGLGLAGVGRPKSARLVDHVSHQIESVLGADGLRMELYAPNGESSVAKRHDLAFAGGGEDLQFGRKVGHGQRVVAGGAEGGGDSRKKAGSSVVDSARSAVHDRPRGHDAAAEAQGNRLHSQAHAKGGQWRSSQGRRRRGVILGSPWSRREHDQRVTAGIGG